MFNKNDIKYILKKVIIVLITSFIFFGIHKSVSAESLNQTIDIIQNNSYFRTSVYKPTTHIFDFELSSSFSQNIGSSYNFTISNYVQNNTSSDYTKYIVFYNENLEQYVVSKFSSEVSSYNLVYDNQLGYFTSDYGTPYLLFKYDENLSNFGWNCNDSSTCFMGHSSYNPYSITTNDNKSIGIIQNIDGLALFANNIGLNLDYEIIDTNIENLTINNNPYTDYYGSSVPSNFTKIDLTGYQAVLITPISYETMLSESSHTTQPAPGVFNTYLDFTFYSQYCTRPSLIDISNTKNVILNENGVITGGAASLSGTCPDEPTEYTLSYQYDMYTGYKPYGLLVYNTQINKGDNWNTNSTYMTSYVWYDTTLYNYELISDLSSLDLNIDYIDFTGENKSLVIEKLPSLDELFQNAIETYGQNSSEELNSNKLQNFLEFIKLPFTFLSNLNTFSCKPLSIPFPRTGRTINLPCMSTIYENILPDSLINILEIIINGLLIYRITLSNIAVVRSILDPGDDKLEVLEL